MRSRARILEKNGYEPKVCQNCGRRFTPIFSRQLLHPCCKAEWRRVYERKYQRRLRESMKVENGQA